MINPTTLKEPYGEITICRHICYCQLYCIKEERETHEVEGTLYCVHVRLRREDKITCTCRHVEYFTFSCKSLELVMG